MDISQVVMAIGLTIFAIGLATFIFGRVAYARASHDDIEPFLPAIRGGQTLFWTGMGVGLVGALLSIVV